MLLFLWGESADTAPVVCVRFVSVDPVVATNELVVLTVVLDDLGVLFVFRVETNSVLFLVFGLSLMIWGFTLLGSIP